MVPYLILAFVAGFLAAAFIFWRRRVPFEEALQQRQIDLATAEAALKAEREKSQWSESAREQLRDVFKALASDELVAKSVQLRTTAKEELGGLVGPLKDELAKLDRHVRELESKREGAYSRLGTQIEVLQGLQESLKQQTTVLAQALRAPTVRGRWGEVQLRRLVELAGMEDHVDFDEQVTGDSLRPDMIVHLPQAGVLPIDSKVPLEAFLRAMETNDDQLRKRCLEQHAGAMRSRVRELSQKAYWDQFDKSPEVVVMFVPVEASIGAAFEYDPDLFEYAIANKVLVSSPVVLFALLKAVAYGWQQHQIARNAVQIAELGKTVYERVAIFVDHLSGMGKSLEGSVKKYNEAIGSLEGRLLPAARRFRDLGAATQDIESPEHIDVQPRLPLGTTDRDSSSY